MLIFLQKRFVIGLFTPWVNLFVAGSGCPQPRCVCTFKIRNALLILVSHASRVGLEAWMAVLVRMRGGARTFSAKGKGWRESYRGSFVSRATPSLMRFALGAHERLSRITLVTSRISADVGWVEVHDA